VPGRIEIFGKHTDYAGGRSLVAAVPRGFAIVAAPRADDVVAATDVRWSVSMDVRLTDDHRRYHGWANYVAVVARRLARNFPDAALGADISFASDLPRPPARGSRSSSASLRDPARTSPSSRNGARRCPSARSRRCLGAVENGRRSAPGRPVASARLAAARITAI
jgi:galactokinase